MNNSSVSPATARNFPAVDQPLNRRRFLQFASASVATVVTRGLASAAGVPNGANQVNLPPLANPVTETKEPVSIPRLAPDDRVGFALVGLGHIVLDEVLPAFAECKYARPAALVSGHPEKAQKIARQLGLPDSAIYNYTQYAQLADNPNIKAVYIALPNALHAGATIKCAQAGKHILCEKPMANSPEECRQMIDACARARVKLMIAYRSQYETLDRELLKAIRAGKLGKLREFVSANSQNQGDPTQWRLNKALAGGGCLPDVGIYCINAARFLSGEEPTEVQAQVYRPGNDPRFREVEATAQFMLKFPTGFQAVCSCGYDSHKAQFFRLQGTEGWAEMSPAFAYSGLKLRLAHLQDGRDQSSEISLPPKNQFAAEIDHMAECILTGGDPHTPGEEGLQDMRIVEAIYQSAAQGKPIHLAPPSGKVRGPDLAAESQ